MHAAKNRENRMRDRSTPALRRGRVRPLRTLSALCVALFAISASSGCVTSAYEQIQLGELWPKRANLLPAGTAIRTSFGVVQSGKTLAGDQESLVLFVDAAERVTAKFDAVQRSRSAAGTDRPRFQLRGEMDRQAAGFADAGPMSILRSVADVLTNKVEVLAARETQHTVAAGLIRILQSWPGAVDEGPGYPQLMDALDRVSGGGEAQSGVSARGTVLFNYTLR